MLFIAADDTDDRLEDDGATAPKAQLDDSEASRAQRKVDLDLDDAPFLEDEEEEEESIDETPPEAPPSLDASEKKPKKSLPPWLTNKYLYIGAVGALVVFLLIWFFFLRPSKQAPAPKPAPEPVVEQPKEPEVPPEVKQDNLVKLDPFLVEVRDKDNQTRFLEISLVFATPDQFLADNLVRLTPTVRYALYYYMHSKDLTFLTDETNSENLKKELLAVVNQYMSSGKFETVLFEEYVVK